MRVLGIWLLEERKCSKVYMIKTMKLENWLTHSTRLNLLLVTESPNLNLLTINSMKTKGTKNATTFKSLVKSSWIVLKTMRRSKML
jgi:hypothetical protein